MKARRCVVLGDKRSIDTVGEDREVMDTSLIPLVFLENGLKNIAGTRVGIAVWRRVKEQETGLDRS